MEVKFSEIVALAGMPGLHKVVKADTKNVIIEALDETQKRQIVKGNMMVSKLSDIAIYTNNDQNAELIDVCKSIAEKYGNTIPVTKKSSNAELLNFLESVLPDYDKDKVYASNVKKLVQWYEIMVQNNISFEKEVVAEETASQE